MGREGHNELEGHWTFLVQRTLPPQNARAKDIVTQGVRLTITTQQAAVKLRLMHAVGSYPAVQPRLNDLRSVSDSNAQQSIEAHSEIDVPRAQIIRLENSYDPPEDRHVQRGGIVTIKSSIKHELIELSLQGLTPSILRSVLLKER